jgi:hypothetical protein
MRRVRVGEGKLFIPTRFLAAISGLAVFVACSSPKESQKNLDEGSTDRGISSARTNGCDGAATEKNGARRVALLIGVGKYINPKITTLKGPANDIDSIYKLLTGKDGYEFPKENVCVVLDEQATYANVHAAFDKLAARVKGPTDQVLIFYSGHGSQSYDSNGDEPDNYDETLVLHDSRTGNVTDFLDDELAAHLDKIHAITPNVVTIFDSCNSGTVTRGDGDDEAVSRWVEPLEQARMAPDQVADATDERSSGDQGEAWTPFYAGLVQLSGAIDGTSALEPRKGGNGYFTAALISALTEVSSSPKTWSQIALQVNQSVEMVSKKQQIPRFQGALDKVVFEVRERTMPQTWEIDKIDGETAHLVGLPTPGLGSNARMLIYPAAASRDDVRNPAKAKAELIVSKVEGLTAEGKLTNVTSTPALGDRGVMVLASRDVQKVKFRIKNSELAANLKAALAANPVAGAMLEVVNGGADFELAEGTGGTTVLRGSDGNIRNSFSSKGDTLVKDVVQALENHARQVALLALRGETGGDFENDVSLGVEFRKPAKQPNCARKGWSGDTGKEEKFSACNDIEIWVKNNSAVKLHVGGLGLFSDGNYQGFPGENNIELPAGAESRIDGIRTTPPYDVVEHILIFGTRDDNIVKWGLVASGEGTKGPGDSSLQTVMLDYMAGEKSAMAPKASSRSTWTSSHRSFRVVPNAQYSQTNKKGESVNKETTISNFEIAPYMPADPNTALAKVLKQANDLAKAAPKDGIPYKQHAWRQNTDKANLKKGIDCSRAIWFAFTRPKLKFNDKGEYLDTSRMFGKNSPMAQQFDRCDSHSQLRTGDILVYRGKSSKGLLVGHTVMVIDPAQRIAWGSHGWDSAQEYDGKAPDTGVEYQQIRSNDSWNSWDVRGVKKVGCWRYKQFAKDFEQPSGRPGKPDVNCDAAKCALE